ncbi:MAG: tRNA1(Val) (adenine(37)-N6)-methyltransferase [Desulfopila sp.]
MNDSVKLSKDSLFHGELICYQNTSGYRFSIDSVLLAHFILHWQDDVVLDMGCGCGIVGMILLYRNAHIAQTVEGLEYQQSLVRIARKNSQENGMSSRLTITHGDAAHIHRYYHAESFTKVMCNPPFYPTGSGRVSKNQEKYVARHQVALNTGDLAGSISYVLANKGRFALVFAAELLGELIKCLHRYGLQPKRVRPVLSYPDASAASLVLVEGIKNGGRGMVLEKPLYVYDQKKGQYSRELKEMYTPNPTAPNMSARTLC